MLRLGCAPREGDAAAEAADRDAGNVREDGLRGATRCHLVGDVHNGVDAAAAPVAAAAAPARSGLRSASSGAKNKL